jgi:hypothetical protein
MITTTAGLTPRRAPDRVRPSALAAVGEATQDGYLRRWPDTQTRARTGGPSVTPGPLVGHPTTSGPPPRVPLHIY